MELRQRLPFCREEILMRWPTATFPNPRTDSLTPSSFPSAVMANAAAAGAVVVVVGVAVLAQEMQIPMANNHANTHMRTHEEVSGFR